MKYFLEINILVLIVFFSLSLSRSFSQESDTEFWKPFFEQGFIFMQQGKIEEAELEFKKILQCYNFLKILTNRKVYI